MQATSPIFRELSYDTVYGIACICLGSFGILCTILVTGIYLVYRDTAIVKASGRVWFLNDISLSRHLSITPVALFDIFRNSVFSYSLEFSPRFWTFFQWLRRPTQRRALHPASYWRWDQLWCMQDYWWRQYASWSYFNLQLFYQPRWVVLA